jgi:Endonuclease I/Secretion system C-terminal sorting domain
LLRRLSLRPFTLLIICLNHFINPISFMKLPNLGLFAALLFCFLRPLSIEAQFVIHSENFNTPTAISWIQFDEADNTDVWTFPVGGYAEINGFGGADDLDWLISPEIDMDNSTNETFTFKTKNRYPGAATGPAPTINLELKYTTNYTGNPATTVWVNIPLPASVLASNTTSTTALSAQTTHSPFDISTVAGSNVRFAFRYYGTATASKLWQIDDIEVAGAVICNVPNTQATTFSSAPSNTSATISWSRGDGSNSLVLINTTNSFTAPTDGSTYTAVTTYGGGQQTVYTGIGTSVAVTGLAASTTYYVQVYNFETCQLPIDYVTASPLMGTFTTTSTPTGGSCTRTTAQVRASLPAHTDLGYDGARRRMYGNCDNQNNTVTCVYGGYTQAHPSGSTATSISLSNGQIINAEHTVPQSFFGGGAAPMVSDMCHLFPTYAPFNSDRGNSPFSEIPDAQTTKWERLLAVTTGIPASNIEEYSEFKSGTYEPRESQKGNTARAIFYFYTQYESQMNNTYGRPITDVASIQTLYNWHIQDPITQADIDRNNCIKTYQGNGNPYIDNPLWIAEVFGCNIVIPVELMSFDGKNQGTYNALTWQTASEKNAQYIAIERKDKETWGEIGRVKAAGNTLERQSYSFDDAKPNPLSIYRLRMVDMDGTEAFSKTITIENQKKAFSLKMFPNPAKDFVTFRATTNEKQAFDITVTDITGRVLIRRNYPVESGNIEEQMNISSLPSGVYFFTFDNGVHKTVEQFVRQ